MLLMPLLRPTDCILRYRFLKNVFYGLSNVVLVVFSGDENSSVWWWKFYSEFNNTGM